MDVFTDKQKKIDFYLWVIFMEDNIIINENEKIGIETECGDNIAFEIKYSYKKQLQGLV